MERETREGKEEGQGGEKQRIKAPIVRVNESGGCVMSRLSWCCDFTTLWPFGHVTLILKI